MKKRKSKRYKLINTISFLTLFFITSLMVKCKGNDYSELKRVSDNTNKTCPQTLDANLRLDSTGVSKPLTIKYNLTMLSVNKDSLGGNLDEFKEDMRKNLQNTLDTSNGMKAFRDKNVMLNYHYRDNTGRYLFDFSLKPGSPKKI